MVALHEISLLEHHPFLFKYRYVVVFCTQNKQEGLELDSSTKIDIYGNYVIDEAGYYFLKIESTDPNSKWRGEKAIKVRFDLLNVLHCGHCNYPLISKKDMITLDSACRLGGENGVKQYLTHLGFMYYTRRTLDGR